MASDKTDDDENGDSWLFRSAIGPLRRLDERPPPPAKPKPRPVARMAERDENDARSEFRRGLDPLPGVERGDSLRYRRNDLPPRVLQRLGRGLFAAQDELDLHLADAAQAETLLRRFLGEARDAGYGCVRIIHGKGLHSADSLPVLKNVVDRVLRQRADILAYHSAPAAQGGTGAVLVLLAPR